ncbi:MAG: OmpH family outer membrane protein [Phycisphaerae bacterium]|nr:OmpH family outer membrane protein [Phycisphaerae bacterium]MDD5380461.1 OmpH family outer membrane protein [Phycisphaerae bacterium]
MKNKTIVLTALICVVVLAIVVYKHSISQMDAQQIQEITAKQESVLLDLEKLNKEMESLKAVSTLKPGDEDYAKNMREMAEKLAELQTKEEPPPAEVKQSGEGLKIAVVSIRKIFQDCKKSVGYREEAAAEQNKIIAELEKLSGEIDAEKAGLKTLKEGSSDYMTRAKGLFEKQASYQARQEFYKQQLELKDKMWTKELYQDILRTAGEIAKEKRLDLVLREDEVDFSETNANELGLALRMQKLLYSGGCLDITDEITARLDAEK